MFATAKKILAATSLLSLTVEASLTATMFKAMKIPEPENNLYNVGTTPNILALGELLTKGKYFSGEIIFWKSFM